MRAPRLVIIGCLFSLAATFPSAAAQDTIPADFCISTEEVRLFEMINEYRKSLTLNELPLSRSLSYVAEKHALDLDLNNPDTNTCNFHSWSDKGNWTACCFEKDVKDKSCMISKPKEITAYPGYAYEVIYWENKSANASKAFDQWKQTTAARALITNFKEWENYSWNAVGVAIHKGFAIAWFGEEPDPEKSTRVCDSERVIENKPPATREDQLIVSSATGRYYVIVGSLNSPNDAKEQLNKLIKEGFKKAKVVTRDDKFRISLSDYPTMEQANSAKEALPSKYRDAWVLAW